MSPQAVARSHCTAAQNLRANDGLPGGSVLARVWQSAAAREALAETAAMSIQGLITTSDVFRHPILIVGSFGIATYWRCCKAVVLGRRTTFLECAWR